MLMSYAIVDRAGNEAVTVRVEHRTDSIEVVSAIPRRYQGARQAALDLRGVWLDLEQALWSTGLSRLHAVQCDA